MKPFDLRIVSKNMKSNIPHIVQYQGSKRKLAPQILKYLPYRINRFIEPFAGMAAMSIAVASEGRSKRFIINDLNGPLVALLHDAIETPEILYEKYASIWNEQFTYPNGSEEHFYYVREQFNSGRKDSQLILYLIARCVKGSVRYGSNGNFNQSPDKRRNGTSPTTLLKNIREISSLLKGKCLFQSLDYREILQKASPGDIIYMDPPYQGVCNGRDPRYFSGIDFQEFIVSIDDLNKRGIDFLISYDGSCGDKKYGEDLPEELGLFKVMVNAGVSTQSIFNGKPSDTTEALYVSPGLIGQGVSLQPELNLFAI